MDRDALHCILWSRTDRRGVVRVDQHALAAEFAVSHYTINETLVPMVAEGRLRRLCKPRVFPQVYEVADPARFGAHVVDDDHGMDYAWRA